MRRFRVVITTVSALLVAGVGVQLLTTSYNRRTRQSALQDLRHIGSTVESYQVDHGTVVPVEAGVVADLRRFLEPTYVKQLPATDPWGRPYEWFREGQHHYGIRSWGRDGITGPRTFFMLACRTGEETENVDDDLVYVTSSFATTCCGTTN